MKKKLLALLTSATVAFTLALTGCSGNSQQANETAQEPKTAVANVQDSPDWVVNIVGEENTDQIFVVAGVRENTAWVSMHEKDADGKWHVVMTTPGFIGKYGLGKSKEGDGMTPVGTFHFNYAFGIADDPGCTAFNYQKVTEDDYWSGDQEYMYNQMVNINDYPELNTDDSEHLIDYVYHYQYALNISYNEEGEAGKGSAIFLHCLGDKKPYTGGCIAIPRDCMETVMQTVHDDCLVVIDSLETLSPETWNEWGL